MKKIDEDKKYIISEACKLGFQNKSFLVTGATGMIGRIFVDVLRQLTSENRIYVLGLNLEEVNEVFKDTNVNKTSFDNLDNIGDVEIDYIIHLASPTNSKFLKEKPVETIDFIYSSTKKILDFALNYNSIVLYISSMESYGEVFDEDIREEKQLGYVDLTNTRNSYPETKRMCELLCYSFSQEYKLDVKCVRLAQTFGAGTIKSDPRIFGYLARCAINNENIVLGTKGESYGNYCYIADTLTAFFYALANGKSGETYNVVGDNCRCTILELANLVKTKIANNKIDIEFNLSLGNQYPKPTKLNMDNKKIKSIGWTSKYGLEDMLTRMVDSWKE